MARWLARWLGVTVIALGMLGVPEGGGASAGADTVKLRAPKKKPKAGAKKSKKKTRSKKHKKAKPKKSSKRGAAVVKRPMP